MCHLKKTLKSLTECTLHKMGPTTTVSYKTPIQHFFKNNLQKSIDDSFSWQSCLQFDFVGNKWIEKLQLFSAINFQINVGVCGNQVQESKFIL